MILKRPWLQPQETRGIGELRVLRGRIFMRYFACAVAILSGAAFRTDRRVEAVISPGSQVDAGYVWSAGERMDQLECSDPPGPEVHGHG